MSDVETDIFEIPMEFCSTFEPYVFDPVKKEDNIPMMASASVTEFDISDSDDEDDLSLSGSSEDRERRRVDCLDWYDYYMVQKVS